jgi:hypothetical protein
VHGEYPVLLYEPIGQGTGSEIRRQSLAEVEPVAAVVYPVGHEVDTGFPEPIAYVPIGAESHVVACESELKVPGGQLSGSAKPKSGTY